MTRAAKIAVQFALSVVLSVVLLSKGGAQEAGSLTDTEIEASETRTAFNAVLRDNDRLEQKLKEAQATIAALQNNLTIASTEGEILKRKAAELKLRLEALSLGGGQQDTAIEGRLLKAVATLREAQSHRDDLMKAMSQLLASIEEYRKRAETPDGEVTAMLEGTTRAAEQALSGRLPATDSPNDGSAKSVRDAVVIAIKDDLALIVANIGRESGVKVGTPFNVLRGDEQIAVVRVVDVRDRFFGAVIQDLSSDSKKIKVGDRLNIGAEHRM